MCSCTLLTKEVKEKVKRQKAAREKEKDRGMKQCTERENREYQRTTPRETQIKMKHLRVCLPGCLIASQVRWYPPFKTTLSNYISNEEFPLYIISILLYPQNLLNDPLTFIIYINFHYAEAKFIFHFKKYIITINLINFLPIFYLLLNILIKNFFVYFRWDCCLLKKIHWPKMWVYLIFFYFE